MINSQFPLHWRDVLTIPTTAHDVHSGGSVSSQEGGQEKKRIVTDADFRDVKLTQVRSLRPCLASWLDDTVIGGRTKRCDTEVMALLPHSEEALI